MAFVTSVTLAAQDLDPKHSKLFVPRTGDKKTVVLKSAENGDNHFSGVVIHADKGYLSVGDQYHSYSYDSWVPFYGTVMLTQ